MIRAVTLSLCLGLAIAAQAQQSDTPPPQSTAPATATAPDTNVPKENSDGVRAPVPIYTPEAPSTDSARKAKFTGNVDISCIVGKDGRVSSVQVLQDPGYGLAKKAVEAIKQYKFKPAMKDGKPVAVRIIVQVGFTLY